MGSAATAAGRRSARRRICCAEPTADSCEVMRGTIRSRNICHSDPVRFGEGFGEQRLQYRSVTCRRCRTPPVRSRAHRTRESRTAPDPYSSSFSTMGRGAWRFEHRGEQSFTITERRVNRCRRTANPPCDAVHRQRGHPVGDDQFRRDGDRALAHPDTAAGIASGRTHCVLEFPPGSIFLR